MCNKARVDADEQGSEYCVTAATMPGSGSNGNSESCHCDRFRTKQFAPKQIGLPDAIGEWLDQCAIPSLVPQADNSQFLINSLSANGAALLYGREMLRAYQILRC